MKKTHVAILIMAFLKESGPHPLGMLGPASDIFPARRSAEMLFSRCFQLIFDFFPFGG